MFRDVNGALPTQIADALPSDPEALASVVAQIAGLAVDRAAHQNDSRISDLNEALRERTARVGELEASQTALLAERAAATKDLNAAEDMFARFEGERAALIAAVRQLGERVRKLEGFKRSLLATLHEEGGGAGMPPPQQGTLPPDGDTVVAETLAAAVPVRNMKWRSTTAHADVVLCSHRYAPHTSAYGTPASGAAADTPPYGAAPSYNGAAAAGGAHARAHAADRPLSAVSQTPTGDHRTSSARDGARSAYGAAGDAARGPSPMPIPPAYTNYAPQQSALPTYPSVPPPRDVASTNGAAAELGGADGSAIDGKAFFKLARERLDYPQFSAFLQNIKDLNLGVRDRDACVRRADDIFGPENADLLRDFQALLSRHLAPAM